MTILCLGCNPAGEHHDDAGTGAATTTDASSPGGPTTSTTGAATDGPTGFASTSTSAGTDPDGSDTTGGTAATSGPGDDTDDPGESTSSGFPCPDSAFCDGATDDGHCRHELVLPDGNRLHYWSNLSLTPAPEQAACNARIDRVVIVQHGTDRNAWDYFNTMMEAAADADVQAHTLVVAPRFPSPEDPPLPDGFALWDGGGSGWKSGDVSLTAPPLGSFVVYDHLLSALVPDPAVHPMLTDVVVTGHSAGAQYVQRYAVAGDLGGKFPPQATLRWIVANPSSYLYLDPFRWDKLGTPPAVGFEIPDGCVGYDDYKYGLSNIPADHYVAQHLAGIPALYLDRDVTYLLGDADIVADDNLDTSCEADLQGAHRFERGLVFAGFLDARYPAQSHALVTVPGVGHSSGGMYTSPEGLAALFP